MSILFDPRDARCKSPFGAVTTFAAVDFTFYPCVASLKSLFCI